MVLKRPRVGFAINGEVSLAYQVVGDGPIDLLYVPGYFTHLDVQWESPFLARFLNGLAEHARLIITDRRGWGCSERFAPTDVPTLEDLGADLGAVLDAVVSERAAVMATWECGLIAQVFAAAHPDRVSSLILLDSWVSSVATEDTPWMPDRRWWESMFDIYERRWGRDWDVNGSARRAGGEEEADWFVRMQRASCTPMALIAEGRRSLTSNTAQVLPTIQVPTLVIANSTDSPGWRENGPYIAAMVPGAELITYESHGDLQWYGPAAAILEAVGGFLAGYRPDDRQAVFDRVLATMLFTDIVNSTAQTAAVGDHGWRSTRERHDQMVRTHVSAFSGREVKTMGDGFLVTFDGPARAVRPVSFTRPA